MRTSVQIFSFFAALTWSGISLAQSEPVDKNTGGPYVGGVFGLGQSSTTGDSSPGPAWLLGVDVGLGVKRDTWNRIEFGLEIDRGSLGFEQKSTKSESTLDLDLMALFKAGYGYSLGDHAFGFFRAGVGLAQVSYKGESDSGVAYLLGWDAIFPAKDNLDFSVGVNWRAVQVKFDALADSSTQINIPSLALGARVRL